jgi:predicted DNA-binding protein
MKETTRTMTIRLSAEQAEALDAVASTDGTPVAEAVRAAIAEHIEHRRKDKAFQQRLRESLQRNHRILERLAE